MHTRAVHRASFRASAPAVGTVRRPTQLHLRHISQASSSSSSLPEPGTSYPAVELAAAGTPSTIAPFLICSRTLHHHYCDIIIKGAFGDLRACRLQWRVPRGPTGCSQARLPHKAQGGTSAAALRPATAQHPLSPHFRAHTRVACEQPLVRDAVRDRNVAIAKHVAPFLSRLRGCRCSRDPKHSGTS